MIQMVLSHLAKHAVIDEIQRVPDLMCAVEVVIGKDRKNRRLLLTGSVNILNFPQVAESLAGRVYIINLEGLSLAEISNNKPATLCTDIINLQD